MNVKKILIPAVAGFLISPALMAADIAGAPTAPRSVSDEWLSTSVATDTVLGGVLSVTLQAEYAVGDILTLSFSGAALEAGVLSNITSEVNAAISSVTIGLLSSDASEAVYRVTDVTAGTTNTTIGAVLTIGATNVLTFDAQGVDAADGITVAYAAATDTGLPLDTVGGVTNSVDYITTASQFAAAVTVAFDGVIDVDDNRETFEGGSDVDMMTHLPANTGITFFSSATLVDYDVVVAGDFSWVVDGNSTTAGIQPIAGVFGLPGTCSGLVVTAVSASYTCTNTSATTLVITLTANVSGTPAAPSILPAGAYTITVDVNYTGIGAIAASNLLLSGSAGAWTLNGYQGLIPYMPYGTNISQVIYLANRGLKVGDVTVDWIDGNGESGSLGVIASLGAGTTLKLGQLIVNNLPAAQRANGRLALTVTANVPAKDVQMNSQYNVSGNRAFTLHEDNRP